MRTQRLTKEEILDQVEEILVQGETPAVAKLRAADILLRDLSGGESGEQSQRAVELLNTLVGGATSTAIQEKKTSSREEVLAAFKEWEDGLDRAQISDGFQIREIMEELKERYNIGGNGNLIYKTKQALKDQNWLSKRCASRGTVYFKNPIGH